MALAVHGGFSIKEPFAMKLVKPTIRLKLAKETLRTLAKNELAQVAGGSLVEGGPDRPSGLMMEEGCVGGRHTDYCARM
jgi:hypothetical protein